MTPRERAEAAFRDYMRSLQTQIDRCDREAHSIRVLRDASLRERDAWIEAHAKYLETMENPDA